MQAEVYKGSGRPTGYVCRRNPLKTGLVLASAKITRSSVPRKSRSQSPENGSRPCKVKVLRETILPLFPTSQSPENGSRPCKPPHRAGRGGPGGRRRNPLKTGLVLARRIRPRGSATSSACRNPLKTGLVLARRMRNPSIVKNPIERSQSPENGSRPCKLSRLPLLRGPGNRGSQSPENGSRPCKGGGGFFFSSPLYHPLTLSFPPASIRLRVL